MNFPLYDTLSGSLSNKDLSAKHKTELIQNIKDMDIESHELIFVLIKCYFLQNEGNSLNIPYDGVVNTDSIDFNLQNFPNKLRQLLYKFVTLHCKKVAEDNELYNKMTE